MDELKILNDVFTLFNKAKFEFTSQEAIKFASTISEFAKLIKSKETPKETKEK